MKSKKLCLIIGAFLTFIVVVALSVFVGFVLAAHFHKDSMEAEIGEEKTIEQQQEDGVANTFATTSTYITYDYNTEIHFRLFVFYDTSKIQSVSILSNLAGVMSGGMPRLFWGSANADLMTINPVSGATWTNTTYEVYFYYKQSDSSGTFYTSASGYKNWDQLSQIHSTETLLRTNNTFKNNSTSAVWLMVPNEFKYTAFVLDLTQFNLVNTLTPVSKPYATNLTSYTYTGSTRTLSVSGYNSSYMTRSGTYYATNVGTYTVSYTLKSGYCWSDDNSTGVVSITWYITKQSLTKPTINTNPTYTGSAVSPTLNNYSASTMSQSGTTSSTNVGSYTLKISLRDTTNYQWSGGGTGDVSLSWSVLKLSLAIPTVSGSFTYDGSQRSATVSGLNSTYMTQSGTASATNAGTYTVTFSLINTTNTQWSDGTTTQKSGTWSIARNPCATRPTLKDSGQYTYSGSAISVQVNNYNSSYMTRSGTASATNAGSYTVTYTLGSNYAWTDGTTTTAVSLSWSIVPQSLTKPTINTNPTYTGSAVSPTLNNYSSSTMSQSGTTSSINVGTYTLTISLINSNYQWSGGGTGNVSLSWSVLKLSLTIPTVSGSFTYDGSTKNASVANMNSTYITQTGTASTASAGTYTLTFALKDTANTQWSGGTTTNKTGSWTIAQLSLAIPTVTGSFTYDGTQKSATVSGFNSSYMTQGGNATGTNAGTYTITFTLKDTANTQWSGGSTAVQSRTWTISQRLIDDATITLPQDSFEYDGEEKKPEPTITI